MYRYNKKKPLFPSLSTHILPNKLIEMHGGIKHQTSVQRKPLISLLSLDMSPLVETTVHRDGALKTKHTTDSILSNYIRNLVQYFRVSSYSHANLRCKERVNVLSTRCAKGAWQTTTNDASSVSESAVLGSVDGPVVHATTSW